MLEKNKIEVGFSLEEVVMAAMAREDVVAISRDDELVMEWIVRIINCVNREKGENLNLNAFGFENIRFISLDKLSPEHEKKCPAPDALGVE